MKQQLLIVLGSILSFAVQASSFDCGKATTKVENLICSDTAISKLDEELAVAYKTALHDEKHVGSIRQAQNRWIEIRNGCDNTDCVRRIYKIRLNELASITVMHSTKDVTTSATSLNTPDKPGLFKLDKSMNDNVCIPLGQVINEDIKEYGETRFDFHSEFAKWGEVEEKKIDRGGGNRYSESVEHADVDVNNDGVIDKVIRTRWYQRGLLNDRLNIFPKNTMLKNKLVISDLDNVDQKTIMFNAGNYWLDRHIRKHGLSNLDWYFGGIASLDLMQQNNELYLVAENYAAPLDISAKIYVFQLDKDYQPIDVCIFVKICPCGGCEDLRGNQPTKTLPDKKWCGKAHK